MRHGPHGSEFSARWSLDPEVVFLNHGSFGACPIAVCEYRANILRMLESQPVGFILNDYMGSIAGTLARLEEFVGARAGSVVLVTNATTGVNTVLSNLDLQPGDELLTTGQEYFASKNALDLTAERSSARVIVVPLGIPAGDPDSLVASVMERVTERTRLVLIDHISSPVGLVYPIERLCRELSPLGVDMLVDGAHGPGMVPLDLTALGVAYYTGNAHKWLCSPKSAALLYVRPDRQQGFRPALMSHAADDFEVPLSDFQVEFFWNGTIDPTPRMSIPFAIDYMASIHPGGWAGIMDDNRGKILRAARMIASRTGLQPACPEGMTGSMAAFSLGYRPSPSVPPPEGIDPLQAWLMKEWRIEVPVTFTPNPPGRFLRISAQLYNSDAEYSCLCDALAAAPAGLLDGN
jgi:isopenicillin-N epimerase